MTIVTPAMPSDARAIALLAEEMDRFYGATEVEPLRARTLQVRQALFDGQPSAFALLARHNSQLVGFAAYSFLWPAVGLSRSLFLKELYVAEGARRTGVGHLLMRAVFAVAAEHGCSHVEWQTETTNHDARAFYAHLGVPEFQGKVLCRLDGDTLQLAKVHADGTA